MARRVLVALALSTGACERVPRGPGEPVVIDEGVDAGNRQNGVPDAGTPDASVDGGRPRDAGSTFDAGVVIDAGPLGDAGPVVDAGAPGVPVESESSLVATAVAIADGVDQVVVLVSLKDAQMNGVAGITPSLQVSGAGNSALACTVTGTNGISTCRFSSTVAETKTISLQTPVALSTTTRFDAGPAVLANSSFDGGPARVAADGTSAATFAVTLIDARGNPVRGEMPGLAVSGVGFLAAATATGAQGVATVELRSTRVGLSTIEVRSPLMLGAATVEFVAGPPSATTSTIDAGPPTAPANGVTTIALTATLRDAQGNPVAGRMVQFAALDGGVQINQPTQPTASDGTATGTVTATSPVTRLVTLAAPIVTTTGAVVSFFASQADPSNSTITATPTTLLADGVSSSEVVVTLRDALNRPVSGATAVMSSTRGTVTQGPVTDSQGQTRAFVRSTTAGTAALALSAPISLTGPTLTFSQTLSVQVPLEMLGWPVNFNAATALRVERSQLAIDRADYDGTVITNFEVVCQGPQRQINLIAQSTGMAVTSVTCPTASVPSRVRSAPFTWSGAQTFRAELAPMPATGAFTLHAARVMVTQTGATRTRYLVPLLKGSNSAQGEDLDTPVNAPLAGLLSWWWDPASVVGVRSFELELLTENVLVSFGPSYRLRNEAFFEELVSIPTLPGPLTRHVATITPGPSETRYRLLPNGGAGGWFLKRAAVWVRLENAQRLRLQMPLTIGPSSHAAALPLFDRSSYTNPLTTLASTLVAGVPSPPATVQVLRTALDASQGLLPIGPQLTGVGAAWLSVDPLDLDQYRLSAQVQGGVMASPQLLIQVN